MPASAIDVGKHTRTLRNKQTRRMLLLQMQSAVEKNKWLVELVQDAIMWRGDSCMSRMPDGESCGLGKRAVWHLLCCYPS